MNKKLPNVYCTNKFIDLTSDDLFNLLKKHFKYGKDFDYTLKAKECIIYLSIELDDDPEIKSFLKLNNFIKIQGGK